MDEQVATALASVALVGVAGIVAILAHASFHAVGELRQWRAQRVERDTAIIWEADHNLHEPPADNDPRDVITFDELAAAYHDLEDQRNALLHTIEELRKEKS